MHDNIIPEVVRNLLHRTIYFYRKGTVFSMSSLDKATDDFIALILDSEEYRNYQAELEKVKQVPDLKRQIDEFRTRNYEMQESADIDFGKLDRFEKEYENFRENPLVADFLAAELDLCRAIQGITMKITTALNFE